MTTTSGSDKKASKGAARSKRDCREAAQSFFRMLWDGVQVHGLVPDSLLQTD
ncbi:hypothetical protein BDN70DRAFT_877377 [Pholiota conissans]|uniref:Uncharacterized protein n=1 Tax=Pholiota conissans TaxID=109636 RepID=A0A9P5Z5Z3_9AGAR|nr:hypothetical protein BDN70DRAFT_877377 [Pholiota conissans]